MAIALDATAHPAGAGNLTANRLTNTGSTFATPSFSTGAGPILFVVKTYFDDATPPYPLSSVVNTSGLTWTKRVSKIAVTNYANEYGCEIWTAYSSGGNLSSQTVTVTAAASTKGMIDVLVLNGVASTEAGCIGNNGGFVDDSVSGVSTTVNATVTPAATGSWLAGMFAQGNDKTALTADSNTSAWDLTWVGTTSGYAASGRYKTSGTVATTTASSNVTFGSSTANLFGSAAALEVKVATGGGTGYSETLSETVTATEALATKQGMVTTFVETATASEVLATKQGMNATLAETANPTEAVAPGVAISATLSETATPSDTLAFGLGIACSLNESCAAQDALATAQKMVATLTEQAIALEALSNGSISAPAPEEGRQWWIKLKIGPKKKIF